MSTGAPNEQTAGSPEPDIPGRHLHWRLLLRRPELLRRGSLIALFSVVGPGVLAGLSDDDPADITTSMSRSDLVDFERGSRNFRIFTVVRLAGALEIGFAELLAGVTSWHIRRSRRRNSCRGRDRPKPNATACLCDSGGKGAQNGRSPKRWTWREPRSARMSANFAMREKIFPIVGRRAPGRT